MRKEISRDQGHQQKSSMSSASETELEWLQDPGTIRGLQGIPRIQTPLRLREEAPFFQEQIQRAVIQNRAINTHLNKTP